MSILIGLLIFFVGSFLGVATMCLLQAGSNADNEYFASELNHNKNTDMD